MTKRKRSLMPGVCAALEDWGTDAVGMPERLGVLVDDNTYEVELAFNWRPLSREVVGRDI